MWGLTKINDKSDISTQLWENDLSTNISETANETWREVFKVTHFWWFNDIIKTILWSHIDPGKEIEKLTRLRKSDDYDEEKAA